MISRVKMNVVNHKVTGGLTSSTCIISYSNKFYLIKFFCITLVFFACHKHWENECLNYFWYHEAAKKS